MTGVERYEAGEGGRLSVFAHQRARRMSKFSQYPRRLQFATLMLVLFYSAWVALPLYAIVTGELLAAAALLVASRFGVEWWACSRAAQRIGARLRLSTFARTFLLHPVAIPTFAVLGNLRRPSTWRPSSAEQEA